MSSKYLLPLFISSILMASTGQAASPYEGYTVTGETEHTIIAAGTRTQNSVDFYMDGLTETWQDRDTLELFLAVNVTLYAPKPDNENTFISVYFNIEDPNSNKTDPQFESFSGYVQYAGADYIETNGWVTQSYYGDTDFYPLTGRYYNYANIDQNNK